MSLVRHMGIKKEIGSRLVVVFMSIPDRQDHALVIEVDGLPDLVRDEVLEIVHSSEGQSTSNLAEVMSKKTMRSGDNGISAIQFLHNRGYLKAMPTDQIIMTPTPTDHKLLSEINDIINGKQIKSSDNKESSDIQYISTKNSETVTVTADMLYEQAKKMISEANVLIEAAKSMSNSSAQENFDHGAVTEKKTRGRPKKNS